MAISAKTVVKSSLWTLRMAIKFLLSVDDNFTENHPDAVNKSKIAQQRPSKGKF